jgi:DnaJ-class molecular chaperone
MPRGSKPGEHRGGRKKGVVNRTTKLIQGLIMSPAHETATERLQQIVEGKLPCQKCHGKGKTKYQSGAGKIFERRCESCYGEGLEKLSPELIGKVAMFLRREVVPDLKAIEHSGSDTKPPIGVRVVLVKSGD